MATWDDVRRIAADLSEVSERRGRDGLTQWRVRDKLFVWERPLRPSDLAALGDAAPGGAVLAARVPDLGVKEALIADQPEAFFTIPHFDGYHAVLVRLDEIGRSELEELVTEAWLCRAPAKLAKAFLANDGQGKNS